MNSIGGNGSSPIKQLTELMAQEHSEMGENPEYILCCFISDSVKLLFLFSRAKMNMVDVICLAIHLYSLVGKQCTSGITEDMRFQVFILNQNIMYF